MKLNLSDYEHWRHKIIEYYNESDVKRVLEITTMSGVPLLITYTILQEEFGGFENDIKKMKEFYKDCEVIKEKK